MKLKIAKLHEDAVIPKYETEGAACFDLVALEDAELVEGETKIIRTGLAMDIPKGYEVQIRPRSGLSLRTKLGIHIGTVDSDYKKEVGIIATNLIPKPSHGFLNDRNKLRIKKGDRIAQGKFQEAIKVEILEVKEIKDEGRGGYGSTGKAETKEETNVPKGQRRQSEGDSNKIKKQKPKTNKGKQDSKVGKQDSGDSVPQNDREAE